jgi:DNA polymerase-3 subunit chi
MPEISFYLLASTSERERFAFACKLVEKAYRSQQRCYLLTDSAEQSAVLDDLLWTFRAGSFIPHRIFDGQTSELPDFALVSHLQPPENWRHTIINLSSHCPEQFQAITRLLEILDQNEAVKAAGRLRYRQYQGAGIEVLTHKID